MRRFFSHSLLVVLVLVAGFAVVRLVGGGDDGDAVVALGDGLEPDGLRHEAFRVERPARLAVHAVGSFETDSTLGATAWIVRRGGEADGTVAWRLDPRRATRGRNTLATLADTVAFAPGVYDAYFASYGDPLTRPADAGGDGFLDRLSNFLSRGGRAWHGDADRWRFRVAAADAADRDHLQQLEGDARDALVVPTAGDGVAWATGPVGSGESREFLFEVAEPAALRVQAAGEVRGGRVRDGAALLRLVGADTLWAMTARNTAPAGGSAMNRRADTVLTLPPGLYRAVYATDGAHAYGDWRANPPFVPTAWGLTVTAADSASTGRVAPFDPWARLPRLASFTCVGPDEEPEDTFTLPDTTHVLLAALGEIIGSTAYDYALLLRGTPGGGAPQAVWTMGEANTRHAGGDGKNREAEAMLTLAPGTYTLRYVSDGSHDCTGFNDDEPPHPDRWGATLFVLDPGFDLSRVAHAVQVPDVAAPPPSVRGEVLVQLVQTGNSTEREATFTLDAPTNVRIYAVGELVPSGSYDWGWIEDDDGDTVWEMTRENTRWAGGSKSNRVFDGPLALAPGRYTAYYETDGSHAYGAWEQPPPNDPEAWGLTIWEDSAGGDIERAVQEAERAAREAERMAREAERRWREAMPEAPPLPPAPSRNDGGD